MNKIEIMLCPHCKVEIPTNIDVCPHCHKTIGIKADISSNHSYLQKELLSNKQLQKQDPNMFYMFLAAVIVIIIGLCAFFLLHQNYSHKDPSDIFLRSMIKHNIT